MVVLVNNESEKKPAVKLQASQAILLSSVVQMSAVVGYADPCRGEGGTSR